MTNLEKQPHRNSRENFRENSRDENFKPRISGKTFFRAGQIFSVIYHLSLLALILILIQKGESQTGLKVFAINAAIVICVNLVSTIERIFFNKNRPYKGNFRRNNNNKRRVK